MNKLKIYRKLTLIADKFYILIDSKNMYGSHFSDILLEIDNLREEIKKTLPNCFELKDEYFGDCSR